jgi:UDP-N-acetylglucosamine pyrophosphorylase
MAHLLDIIQSSNSELKNSSIDAFCSKASISELLAEAAELDVFRRTSPNLYLRVRSLFFLYAIHRFYIPVKDNVSSDGLIPYEAYEHLLNRRFEEAIDLFMEVQAEHGANEGISSGLADAYHKLAFQTLADQVRSSVKSTPGNQWMFRIGHPDDHPLSFRKDLLRKDENGLYPILHESTPVRMDITHCGWSDIFFLGMDFPEGAQVLNISVNLCINDGKSIKNPVPPIETFLRVIDEPVLRLTSVDLETTRSISRLDEIFDFAKDYLGLLKAGIIASGLIPSGMEGAGMPLCNLLENMVGRGKGIEIVTQVNNIPKGSRLAVSTNLLASIISLCMRATGQTEQLTGMLLEEERRLVAARAILGEWLGGSGGGWQDSGGVWPGIKLIKGVEANNGDPEFSISKGRLLPLHTLLDKSSVSIETRAKIQDCLVIVHGGMAQDVGPILEMVTEKYLLRSDKEWEARKTAIRYFDEVVDKLKAGKIDEIGKFTQQNFEGPIQTIIPWSSNLYTETIIKLVQREFGEHFLGFWMMGGMSGGGMGFIFEPEYKTIGQESLRRIMSETKQKLIHAVAFAMEPVVYDFRINERGTYAVLDQNNEALLPSGYYTLTTPEVLKKEMNTLTSCQRIELEIIGKIYKEKPLFENFIPKLFERMIPQSGNDEVYGRSLDSMLKELGFDKELHLQIKNDLKLGRIGLAQNRLPVNNKIEDVLPNDIFHQLLLDEKNYYDVGLKALKNGELAIVTLAGGVGSRWTSGAGVVKSLNPFSKLNGKHRNFIETHLAKSRKIGELCGTPIPHVFTTSHLTHHAIESYLRQEENYGYDGAIHLSQGKVIGQRLIPMERDLRFLWEEMPQQLLDEQAQKMHINLHNALINWAKEMGEGEDYRDNLASQCIHPVGHWFEVPNLLLNGTLKRLLDEQPRLKHLLIHNIDTLGANADPILFGFHILNGAGLTSEVISRKLDDRGGGLAKIQGRLRLIEGLALPDEKIEFNLSYYNTNTTWVEIDQLLKLFELSRQDLNNQERIKQAILNMSKRMPTYVTIKDVKKRWGKGQEDIFPVTQFEKLWGDMTALPELKCSFIHVNRNRGQQLKEVSQLDGWLRDGSASYVESICDWGGR